MPFKQEVLDALAKVKEPAALATKPAKAKPPKDKSKDAPEAK